MERQEYRIGIPQRKDYRIVLNSDEVKYGGSGMKQPDLICYEYTPMHGKPFSLVVDLPPMSVLLAVDKDEELVFDAVISEE